MAALGWIELVRLGSLIGFPWRLRLIGDLLVVISKWLWIVVTRCYLCEDTHIGSGAGWLAAFVVVELDDPKDGC